MNFTEQEVRKLVEVYPFLLPINIWTGKVDEHYQYDYIRGQYELPVGWHRLFLLYCKHLRVELVKADMLNSFQFSDIKEKYGFMRLDNFGYPGSALYLETIHEAFSNHVCYLCGELAEWETRSYVVPMCSTCAQNEKFECKKVPLKSCAHVTRITAGGNYEVFYSFKELKKEYKQVLTMSSEEFIDYLLTVE